MSGFERWTSPDDRITKVTISKGTWKDKPRIGSTCAVHVTKVQKTEEMGASNYLQENSDGSVEIGEGETALDRLLELCLIQMLPGEVAAVTLRPGGLGNSVDSRKVEFVVRLCEVQSYMALPCEWSNEIKLEKAKKYKEKGTDLFRLTRLEDSFHFFSSAVKLLISIDRTIVQGEQKNDIESLEAKLYNNMASCQLTRRNYEHVVDLCAEVLRLEPDNIKALYRRGSAYVELQEFEKAQNDLTRGLRADPKNQAVTAKLQLLKRKKNDLDAKYARAMKKIFL